LRLESSKKSNRPLLWIMSVQQVPGVTTVALDIDVIRAD
jgi:hypothetical protein